jgi:SAM-dependent methyltransferase
MSPDLTRRSDAAELMDGPCDFETFRGCLKDLARANTLTLTHRPTIAFLDRLRRSGRIAPGQTTRIVDVGSGYGDLLRLIDRWGAKHGLSLDLVGVDLNPWSARSAVQATSVDRPIRWLTANVFDYQEPCDVVVSSLFTHHLKDAELIRFLSWMEAHARVGWFINDLHRHPFSYYGFGLLARVMRWHRFVQHDGPVSIARAFSRDDWLRLLAASGLAGVAEVHRRFPFRLCVSRVR